MSTTPAIAASRLRAAISAAKHDPDNAYGGIVFHPRYKRLVAVRTDLGEITGIDPSRAARIVREYSVPIYPKRWVDAELFATALENPRRQSDRSAGGIEL